MSELMKETNDSVFNLFGAINIIKRALINVRKWVRSGISPPDPQRRMIYVILFLLAFGVLTAGAFVFAVMGIHPFDYMRSWEYLLIVSFICLCPGIYGAFVSFCCWRNVAGYDWWIIPGFDM